MRGPCGHRDGDALSQSGYDRGCRVVNACVAVSAGGDLWASPTRRTRPGLLGGSSLVRETSGARTCPAEIRTRVFEHREIMSRIVGRVLVTAAEMSLPRQVLPGRFYLVTRLCTQRQFLLRPDAATNNAFTYCLIEAAQRTKVEVILPCAMSNHYLCAAAHKLCGPVAYAEFACQVLNIARFEGLQLGITVVSLS
jgi:hypothetical protein